MSPSKPSRRAVLAAGAAAITTSLSAAPTRSKLKLSVRVEPLFPGMQLADQVQRVAAAGYDGFEFGDWRAVPDPSKIVALQNKLNLTCVSLVGNKSVNPKGMGLCDPAERQGFLAEFQSSLEAAKRFEAQQIVVLSGFKVPGMTRPAQHASIVEGLKRAHDLAAQAKVTIVVEVINTLAKIEPLNPKGDNHANYYLDRTAEAFEIMREAGSPPFMKVLYDLYHVQIMEGNLIETIRENIGLIGHFHVADVPGRHEPGTGEINFASVFRAIRDTGYNGFTGMEYIPTGDAMQSLRDVRRLVSKL
jgi:hydroxypyruvate isomerase